MPNLDQLIACLSGLPDDADLAAAVLSTPTPRQSEPATTYVTYLSIGQMPDPFGGNTAGKLRTGLLGWAAGPDLSQLDPRLPNPGQLLALHDRLAGYPGVDMASAQAPGLLGLFAQGVEGLHAPLLTAGQSAALLAVGYDYPCGGPVTAADVTAARAESARRDAISADRAGVLAWVNDVANVALADPAAPYVTPAAAFGGGA